MWNKFDEDRKSLDSKLTAAERELSCLKTDDMTFQQMKDALPHLKVTTHSVETYYYYYYRFMAPWTVTVTTRVSQYQRAKTNLVLLEQEIVSGSGISLADLHLC